MEGKSILKREDETSQQEEGIMREGEGQETKPELAKWHRGYRG